VAVVVLDASVAIALLDANDVHHDACRAALEKVAGDDLHLPASAYAEALVQPARARRRLALARASLDALLLVIGPIDKVVAEQAATLRARSRMLRLADALVLAYALSVGADAVLTTDRRWRRFQNVEIVT
jgi:predicted nucleic acid-binding protein